MTRQTLKKATVAALLSSFLILAVPAMGVDNSQSAPVVGAEFGLESVVAWIRLRLDLLVAALEAQEPPKDNSDEWKADREQAVSVFQRTCSAMSAEGCKD